MVAGVAGRHAQVRISGDRGRGGGADQDATVVAAGRVGQPGRWVGGRDDRGQLVVGQRRVDRRPGPAGGGGSQLEVVPVGQVAAGGLGLLEGLLPEVRQLLVGVRPVEGDQLGQVGRVVAGGGGEVRVQVVLRTTNGNYDLWMRAGRGRLVPRDGASLWRYANHHRGSGI